MFIERLNEQLQHEEHVLLTLNLRNKYIVFRTFKNITQIIQFFLNSSTFAVLSVRYSSIKNEIEIAEF